MKTITELIFFTIREPRKRKRLKEFRRRMALTKEYTGNGYKVENHHEHGYIIAILKIGGEDDQTI